MGIGEAVLSETGEEPSKISERASEEAGFERGTPLPNLKEGSWASGLGLVGTLVVLYALALEAEGRRGFDLLLSTGMCREMASACVGLEDRGVRQSEKSGSDGVCSGVGDCSSMLYAHRMGLWGRGDISMQSIIGAGEEDVTGGVARGAEEVNILPWKRALRGVGYCGLLLSMFMFWDKSAARLAVGDDPRTGGGMLK